MTNDVLQKSFLQDLWDRRFFPLIGTYLGISFGLIQFAEFLVSRYDFSQNIVEKLIVFLLVMLPATGILIYNHGQAGPQKWLPFEKIFIPASAVCGLILAGAFFNATSASANMEKISITDESGETITRIIPKTEYTKRFVIFPFENKTGSENNDWLSVAGAYLLDKDLEQDMRTFSIQPLSLKNGYESYNYQYLEPIPFATQLKIAQDYYADYFITGVLEEEAGQLKLSLQVSDANSSENFYSHSLSGKDIFELIDGLTKDLNDQLFLESVDAGKIIDLPISNLVTDKLDALQAFIEGELIWAGNVQKVNEAIKKLEQSIILDPRCSECFASLAQLSFAMSNEVKMLEYTDKALQLANSLPERQQLNIRYFNYMAHNQPDRAMLLSENWRKLYPSDYTPYRNLINYYRQSLQLDKAKEVGLTALQNGHEGDLLTTLASLYINTEEYEEAEKYMKQFAALYPHKAKDQTLLGEAYSRKGELEKARRFYNDLLIMAPNEVNILLKLGGVEDKLGNFSQALDYYKEALSKSNQIRDSILTYTSMEGHYERQGQYLKSFAISENRKALADKIQPPSVTNQQFFFTQAYKYILNGQEEKVLNDLDALTKQLPQSAQIIDCVGKYLFYMWTENLAEFETYSQNCLHVLRQFSGANFKYIDEGVKARLNGDFIKAGELYQTYIDSTGLGDTQMGYELSEVYRLGGQIDKADKFINELLQTDPFQPIFLIEKSKVLKEQGKLKEAKDYYEKAMNVWKNADQKLTSYQDALAFGEGFGKS